MLQKLTRALLLRCPRCGSRGILRSWFKLHDRCPNCSLAFERGEESDYWLGAYTVNLVVAEGLSLAVALILLRAYWPNATPATWVGVAMAIATPFLFFPFSRTIWLAVDLTFRRDEDTG